MAEYVNLENLIKDLKNNFDYKRECGYKQDIDLDSLIDYIEQLPAADVVEVKHGKINWRNRPITAQYATITDEFGDKCYGKLHESIENNPVGYCSECGKRLDDTFMNFCPNCGAKMDDKVQEEVKCKDCDYLVFSDCYGECSKAYKGIVSPDDSCGRGKRRQEDK